MLWLQKVQVKEKRDSDGEGKKKKKCSGETSLDATFSATPCEQVHQLLWLLGLCSSC